MEHQGRDEAWLDSFLSDQLPNVWIVAVASSANEDDAEEVVAEACAAFIAAFRDGRLDEHADPLPYLLQAVRNGAIDLHRRHRRSVVVDPRAEPAGLTPEGHLDDMVDRAAVMRAFARLTERFRLCLRLVAIEGQTMESAGRLLGLNANATRQLTHRARRRLRLLYVEEMSGASFPRDCARVVRALVGGAELNADEEGHLEGCDSCRAAQEDLRAVGLWRTVPPPVPVGLAAAVGGTAVARGPGSPSPGGGPAGRLLAASAAAVVALAAVGAVTWSEMRDERQAEPAASTTTDGPAPPEPLPTATDPEPGQDVPGDALAGSGAGGPDHRGSPLAPVRVPERTVRGAHGRAPASPRPAPSPRTPGGGADPAAPPAAPDAVSERSGTAPETPIVSAAVDTPAGPIEIVLPGADPLPPIADVEVRTTAQPSSSLEVLGIEILPGAFSSDP